MQEFPPSLSKYNIIERGKALQKTERFKSIVTILIIIIPPLFFGISGDSIAMSISIIPCFICAVFINLDRFESFKAGEMEAKLREADSVIREANATIDQLKAVAEPLLNTNLVSLAYEGYFGGMDVDDKVKVFKKLFELKDTLALNSNETNELLEKTKKAIAYNLFSDIGKAISLDGLQTDTIFFSKYSIEADVAFATVEDIESHLNANVKVRSEKVNDSFEKFKKFINSYYLF